MLTEARDGPPGPVLVHVVTEKGKGYQPAETAADRYHGVVKFDVGSGVQVKTKSNAPSYTKVFAESLLAEAKADERIVAITAAMPTGTGLDLFARTLPERCFDVGIAEQHAVTFAAGLACQGLKPFVAIYSTFLQRAYDQIIHDVALQGLPVRFAIDRAGLVGADGPTHVGAFDVASLACVPGMVLMAAADEAELVHMVATAAAHDTGPIAFRYPRGDGTGVDMPERGEVLPIGKGRVLREGSDVAILSFGTRLAGPGCRRPHGCRGHLRHRRRRAVRQAPRHRSHRRSRRSPWRAHHPRRRCIRRVRRSCAAMDGRRGPARCRPQVRTLALPDRFQAQDSPAGMYREAGLDAEAIAALIAISPPPRGLRSAGAALARVSRTTDSPIRSQRET